MRNPDFEQLQERDHALTVACRACGAKIGERCTRTDFDGRKRLLENLPAHPKRTKRAQRLQRMAAEENLTMNDDGLFEIAEPDWDTIRVLDLGGEHVGRLLDLGAGAEVRFTGTHRGSSEKGAYIVVHGTDAVGGPRQCTYSLGAVVSIKAADK